MRFNRIDHIGVAVSDLNAAIATYTRLHGAPPSQVTDVQSEGVRVAFFPVGQTKIELIAALDENSSIAKYISKRGEGIHHICYAVADLSAAITALKLDGFSPVGFSGVGAEGGAVTFYHPKELHGVLVELVEHSI